MNHADKLISLGADCVGGVLIYKNRELGKFRNGVFDINADGLKLIEMDITDVEVKETKPKKAKKVVEAAPTLDDLPTDADLDSLLGE